MSEVLDLARELIRRASVTPEDAGCQELIANRLAKSGFAIEWLDSGPVRNLWATHGSGGEVFLRQTSGLSQSAQVARENFSQPHHAQQASV